MAENNGNGGGERVPAGVFGSEWLVLVFEGAMTGGFVVAAWRWGDRRRWRDYYPTILFAMTVNLFAALVTYHHDLWIFNPAALVRSETVLEAINTFVAMPATVFTFLSRFPFAGKWRQQGLYTLAWIALYSILEAADTMIGGISYDHGWSLGWSAAFDCVMFPMFILHHRRPLLGWLAAAAVAAFVLAAFGFGTAEMK